MELSARYSIVDSANDSARYAARVTHADQVGSNALSFLTTPDGLPRRAGGRLLQGVGYCGDAALGGRLLLGWGRFSRHGHFTRVGKALIRHSVHAGYLDDPDTPVLLYRDSETKEFFNTIETNTDYLDVGHMAYALHNLLLVRSELDDASRSKVWNACDRLRRWVLDAALCENGWMPRRSFHDGRIYPYESSAPSLRPGGMNEPPRVDPLLDRSGVGLYTVALLLEGERQGLWMARAFVEAVLDSFVVSGGHFGSINTDTADAVESFALAVAFTTLQVASQAYGVQRWRDFAYEECLPVLANYQMPDNRNGVDTMGLYRLADSYPAACMAENAVVAGAYLRASADTGETHHARAGLAVLRAMGRHHTGENGFLTAELDWAGTRGREEHVAGLEYGARNVTHPYRNNLQILEPTQMYFEVLRGRRVTKLERHDDAEMDPYVVSPDEGHRHGDW